MSRKRRPMALTALAVVSALAIFWASSCAKPAPRLNVLLVTLDTTRADRLGCYGYARASTPRLDALAKESTVFDRCIAQAANTPVSHASILTGRNPYRHGLRVLHGLVSNTLVESQVTVAEAFQAAGAETAAFVSAYPVTKTFGLGQGFGVFDAAFMEKASADPKTQAGIVNTGMNQRRADDTVTAAIDWMQGKRDRAKPFLVWVHLFDPHDPMILPPQEFLARFERASAGDEDRFRAIYDAEVAFMDAELGRLFDAFRRDGLWETTIVAIVSDHGEGLGDHDWWSHGILYQEQIHVPLVVRVPGMKQVPRIAGTVRSIDVMPTLLRQAGVDSSFWPAMDGEDLTPELSGERAAASKVAYSEAVNILTYSRPSQNVKGQNRKDDKHYAVIDGDWKLIYHQLRPEKSELYDLGRDPRELTNLAPSNAARKDELGRFLDRWRALSPIMPGMTEDDLERARQLEQLGYVGSRPDEPPGGSPGAEAEKKN